MSLYTLSGLVGWTAWRGRCTNMCYCLCVPSQNQAYHRLRPYRLCPRIWWIFGTTESTDISGSVMPYTPLGETYPLLGQCRDNGYKCRGYGDDPIPVITPPPTCCVEGPCIGVQKHQSFQFSMRKGSETIVTGLAPCMMFVDGVWSVSRFAAEDQGKWGLSLGDFWIKPNIKNEPKIYYFK